MVLTNGERKANKKLRIFEGNYPGLRNDRYKELRRAVVTAQVAAAKRQQFQEKKAESLKKQNMSNDEFLDIHFKENAAKNAEKVKLALIKEEQDKKHIAQEAKQQKEYKEFYEKNIQPALAKHIILSIVENSDKTKFEKSKSKNPK